METEYIEQAIQNSYSEGWDETAAGAEKELAALKAKSEGADRLVRDVRLLLNNIYEFDKPTDGEYLDAVEQDIKKLAGEASEPLK